MNVRGVATVRTRMKLLNGYVARQSRQVVIFGIGRHFAYAVESWFQVEGCVYVHSPFQEAGQLSVEDIYLCPPLLGIHQIFFLIENGKDEGYGIEVTLSVLLEMKG